MQNAWDALEKKRGALIKYYFKTSSLHLSLSPRKDTEDRQFHARPLLLSSTVYAESEEGARVFLLGYCKIIQPPRLRSPVARVNHTPPPH